MSVNQRTRKPSKAQKPPARNRDAGASLAPHDPRAERALLGLMLIDNSIIGRVRRLVLEDRFYVEGHKVIYKAIVGLHDSGAPADVVTVGAWLMSNGGIEDAGGPAYIADLYCSAPSERNHESCAAIIRKYASHRDFTDASREFTQFALDLGSDPAASWETAIQRVRELAAKAQTMRPMTLAEMEDEYPAMREPVIDGILRIGETMNIISNTKVGKSWLAIGLAINVAMGQPWLGFPTTPGEVLIIDNELHPETITARMRRVADGLSLSRDDRQRVTIISLRGRPKNLEQLGLFLNTVDPGKYRLLVLDAFYRALPAGTDENSNGMITGLYNLIDQYADRLHTAWVNIHHASKGNQAAKDITDVGSGAGAQSRAPDAHLVLRPHRDENAVVLEAVVRSFPPIHAKCLRWEWPTFTLAEDLDPAELAKSKRETQSKEREEQRTKEKTDRENAEEGQFLNELDNLLQVNPEGVSKSALRKILGFRPDKMDRVELRLICGGFIERIPGFKAKMPNGGVKDADGIRRKPM